MGGLKMMVVMKMINPDGSEKDLGRVWRMDEDPFANALVDTPTIDNISVNYQDGTKVVYEKLNRGA